ncbi:MAG: DUF4097 family beta strand repeat-containing protein [Gemmatimonadota bacterium]
MRGGIGGRLAAAAVACGLAGGLLAGCYVDVGALQHRTRTYQVPGQVRTLVVNVRAGNVHVTGAGTGQVTVTEHIAYRHAVPATSHRVRAGTLTLASSCPTLETCSVGYDIRVPRGLTVRISAAAGTIRLDALAGRVTAHTNAGGVDLREVSGPVAVSSHAGSVTARGLASATATLRSSAGSIDATFTAVPAAVTATTAVGSVTVRVPGSASYAVHASTSVGSTSIRVPRDPRSAHTITASTRTGSLTIEPAS